MFKYNHDPVLFEGPEFESANMSVLHCREVLEQTGMTTEATRLSGIEVTDTQTAEVALGILHKMRCAAEAEYARALAEHCVRGALRS